MNNAVFHYYEKELGPFKNLSSLSDEEAESVLRQIKETGKGFASSRSDDYLSIRRKLETQARDLFISKGGRPSSNYPHYMTLGACQWIKQWYQDGCELSIPLSDLREDSISFTYGDLFPTMRYHDGKEYRKQVYTKAEIFGIIDKFGLPQEWNKDGVLGPERYIEVQVWDEDLLRKYME